MTEANCSAAAETLGLVWQGTEYSETSPMNCYEWKTGLDADVWFNKHPSGTCGNDGYCDKQARPVCMHETTEAPTDATPTEAPTAAPMVTIKSVELKFQIKNVDYN